MLEKCQLRRFVAAPGPGVRDVEPPRRRGGHWVGVPAALPSAGPALQVFFLGVSVSVQLPAKSSQGACVLPFDQRENLLPAGYSNHPSLLVKKYM